MKSKSLLIIISGMIFGIGLGLFLIGSSNINDTSKVIDSITTLSTGDLAPDFVLLSLSGDRIRLNDLKGKPVLINFWATWCGPCLLEMPAIQSRFLKYQSDLDVLAINFDEPEYVVRPYVEELGLTFDVLLDPGGDVQRLFKVLGYPTTFIIDRGGVISVKHIGTMTEIQLDNYLAGFGVGE